MRIRNRSQCRSANGSCVEREQRVLAEPIVVHSSEFHEEIVRVLSVDDRLTECRLSLLEEQRILTLRNRRRLKTEHGTEGDCPLPYVALRHRHDPVWGEELVAAACTGLLRVDE